MNPLHKFWIFLIALFVFSGCKENSKSSAHKVEKTELAHHPIPEWFENEKFGIFVHYGVMGTFEHFKKKSGNQKLWLSEEVFREAGKEYSITDSAIYDWARKFKKWGARYAVLTTSQHPGFALWDSKVTNRTITQLSPYSKDLVDIWSKALRKENLRVGLYFNHEDKGDSLLMKILAKKDSDKSDEAYWQEYLQKRDDKVKELVSNYGKIDLLWFDADWIAKDAEELGTTRLVDMIVEHQPEVVLNNRLRSAQYGHYGTPEKYIPVKTRNQIWETCDNLRNNSLWGFVYDSTKANDYRSAKEIIYTMKEVICSGGNYLLNIGPHPDGHIVPREIEIMDSVGQFVNKFEEAIFNTRSGLPRSFFGEGSTLKDNELYLFTNQSEGSIYIKGFKNEIIDIEELETGISLPYKLFGGRPKHGSPRVIEIQIPENKSGTPNVVKVMFEGELDLQKN